MSFIKQTYEYILIGYFELILIINIVANIVIHIYIYIYQPFSPNMSLLNVDNDLYPYTNN